jgi:hypothetical protein
MRQVIQYLLLVAALALALALARCEGETIRNKDIIGTWVNESGAEIHFKENGRFSYRNLPTAIFHSDGVKVHVLISGDGDTWNLRLEDTGPSIYLEFYWIDEIKRRLPEILYVDGKTLYFTYVPDVKGAYAGRFYFEKKPEK